MTLCTRQVNIEYLSLFLFLIVLPKNLSRGNDTEKFEVFPADEATKFTRREKNSEKSVESS